MGAGFHGVLINTVILMPNIKLLVYVAIHFGVSLANQLLIDAAFSCDNDGVKSALKGSFFHRIGIGSPPADPNFIDDKGSSALHYAARKGCVKSIKTLLAAGADIEQTDDERQTALYDAIMGVQVEAVKVLLNAGAEVNIDDKYRHESPLYYAVTKVPSYHEYSADDQAKTDEIVNVLLKAGADPLKKDIGRTTVLADAFGPFKSPPENIANKVDAMLKYVSDPNIRDEDNASLLHHAAYKLWSIPTNEQVQDWEVQKGGPGCLKVMKVLIDNGVDPNLQDIDGMTALHYVVLFNGKLDYDLLEFLINSGADPTIQTNDGDNVLHFALQNYDNSGKGSNDGQAFLKTIELFLKNNVDPNSQNNDGHSALHLAVMQQPDSKDIKETETYDKIITTLLKYGADPNIVNKSGENQY